MITDREIILAIVDNDCLMHSDAAILLEGDGFFCFLKSYGFTMVLNHNFLLFSAFFFHFAMVKKNPQTLEIIGFEGSEPGGIRTHDLLIRSHPFESAESVDL